MAKLLQLFLLSLSVVMTISKPADRDHPRRSVHWKSKLSDVDHEVDGEHNVDYDHEVFLGKEDAKNFDQLTPEEAKQRLR